MADEGEVQERLESEKLHLRKNRNAVRKQLANFCLAISLAFLGGGFVEVFTNEPRFSRLEIVILMGLGLASLIASLLLLYYMEDEEPDDVQ